MRCPTCGQPGTELTGFAPGSPRFVCGTASCPVGLFGREDAPTSIGAESPEPPS
jgi:hypothetical protein